MKVFKAPRMRTSLEVKLSSISSLTTLLSLCLSYESSQNATGYGIIVSGSSKNLPDFFQHCKHADFGSKSLRW